MPGFVLPSHVRRRPGLLLALVGVGLAVAGTAVGMLPAAAHDELVSSVPAAGEQLAEPPTEVSLTFSASVSQEFAQVAVVDAAGASYQSGPPVVAGDTVTQAVTGLPTGATFTISFRIVSADGHPIGGTVPFSVLGAVPDPEATTDAEPEATPTTEASEATSEAAAPDATPPATAEPVQASADRTGSSSLLPWVLLGAALLTAAALATWASRRRTANAPTGGDHPPAPDGSG
jgi:methionine-rich copper-binding protein CopC